MEDSLLGVTGAPAQLSVAVERVDGCVLALTLLRSMVGKIARD